jgi:hypothetical protein
MSYVASLSYVRVVFEEFMPLIGILHDPAVVGRGFGRLGRARVRCCRRAPQTTRQVAGFGLRDG